MPRPDNDTMRDLFTDALARRQAMYSRSKRPVIGVSDEDLIRAIMEHAEVTKPTARRYLIAALCEPDSDLVGVIVSHHDGGLAGLIAEGREPVVRETFPGFEGRQPSAHADAHVSQNGILIEPGERDKPDWGYYSHGKPWTLVCLRETVAEAVLEADTADAEKTQAYLDRDQAMREAMNTRAPGLRRAIARLCTEEVDGKRKRMQGRVYDFMARDDDDSDEQVPGIYLHLTGWDAIEDLARLLGIDVPARVEVSA